MDPFLILTGFGVYLYLKNKNKPASQTTYTPDTNPVEVIKNVIDNTVKTEFPAKKPVLSAQKSVKLTYVGNTLKTSWDNLPLDIEYQKENIQKSL